MSSSSQTRLLADNLTALGNLPIASQLSTVVLPRHTLAHTSFIVMNRCWLVGSIAEPFVLLGKSQHGSSLLPQGESQNITLLAN